MTKLVELEKESEQIITLKDLPQEDSVKLAHLVKDTYYASWTTEPQKVRNAAQSLRLLEKFYPHQEITALADWTSAIAFLTNGNSEAAIQNLDQAIKVFQALDQEYLVAQVHVSKLYALALVGEYERAVEIGKSALEIFQKHQDIIAVGKIQRNIGNLFYRHENYSDAEIFYQSARKSLIKSEFQSELAMIENSLAVVKALQNDFREAEKLYQSAFAHAESAGLKVTQAEIEASRGNLALFRGKWEEALQFLESSRRRFAELKMPHQTAIAELEIADLYLELNLLPEAAGIYERVAPQFAALKMQAEEARTRINFGRALFELRRFEQAAQQLNNAAKLYEREGNAVGASLVNLIKARLYLTEHRFSEAENLAQSAEKVFDKAGNVRNLLLAVLIRGEAQRLSGNLENARNILENLLQKSIENENPNIELASLNSLGQIAVSQSNFSAAASFFTQAIEKIEEMRAPLPADEFRTAFLADKLTPFHEIAWLGLQQGNIEKSFEYTEKARSRSLLDLLNDSARHKTAEHEALTEKTQRKLDSLREELNWFYSRLNRPPMADAKIAADDFSAWQTSAQKIEKQIHELALQRQTKKPNHSQNTQTFKLTELQAQLGATRAVVEYAELHDEIVAFVVTNESIKFVKIDATQTQIKNLLQKVHFQFAALRHSHEKISKHLAQLKLRSEHLLNRLYNILIVPLRDLIIDKNIVVVPFGVLHYIPFHALFDGESYLIENCQVSYAPSAGVLQFCLKRETENFEKALVVGFADERIPEVENEVRNLAKILPQTEVLIGTEATFSALKLRAANLDVLHLACHAQFRTENPLFSSLHLADGWANVRDASLLELKNCLVTLSACETGLNSVASGDELIGLVRGFLSAGASALLLSLWTVQDAATANLMRDFYSHLHQGKSFAESLRQAQLSFIKQEVHPYFWSPFVLVGHW